MQRLLKHLCENHNVSLVAASPTRHPGPLHSEAGKSDGEEEQQQQQPAALAQQKEEEEERKRDAGFVHISWAAAALTDPGGRPSVRRREAEGPV